MKLKITYWREPDRTYLGYLNDDSDHWTQGTDHEDLKEPLRDLYREFSEDDLPGIRRADTFRTGRGRPCGRPGKEGSP